MYSNYTTHQLVKLVKDVRKDAYLEQIDQANRYDPGDDRQRTGLRVMPIEMGEGRDATRRKVRCSGESRRPFMSHCLQYSEKIGRFAYIVGADDRCAP